MIIVMITITATPPSVISKFLNLYKDTKRTPFYLLELDVFPQNLASLF